VYRCVSVPLSKRTHTPHKVECVREIGPLEVVKEDAADAARLAPMRYIKILVAPALETRVVRRVMLVARRLQLSVKVHCILERERERQRKRRTCGARQFDCRHPPSLEGEKGPMVCTWSCVRVRVCV
jgi:hypothetical protein